MKNMCMKLKKITESIDTETCKHAFVLQCFRAIAYSYYEIFYFRGPNFRGFMKMGTFVGT